MDSKKPTPVTFIRMDSENFFGLFPSVPRVPGNMEREAMQYGMIHVVGRGWDPCAIDGDAPFGVFFQDADNPTWKNIRFPANNVSELDFAR